MSPLPCPVGYFCAEGTALNWGKCPDGTYGKHEGLSNNDECTLCEGGYYCQGEAQIQRTGLCSQDHFCISGVNVSEPSVDIPHTGHGGLCLVGHYCPQGSSISLPCAPSTYNDIAGQNLCFTCPPGYYCPINSSLPIECPSGYYCPEGTGTYLLYPCPARTYNNFSSATDILDCIICPPGEFCPTPGLTLPLGLCSEGHYCTSGSTTRTPVDVVVKCNGKEFEPYLCNSSFIGGGVCPPGYFCPTGSVFPQPCSEGMYCPLSMQGHPAGNCSAGYFCIGTSTTPEQYPCPKGHYCPVGSGSPTPCPLGTYSNSIRNEHDFSCLSCPPGMYCNSVGASMPSGLCAAGYFCPPARGDRMDPNPPEYMCPRGHYCSKGSALPVVCSEGSYQPYKGQVECLECPPGFFCDPSIGIDSVTTPYECPEGYFCPSGTGFILHPCPPGTFSNMTRLSVISECTDCLPSMYCEGFGLTFPDGSCYALPGYFCGGGADSPTPHYVSVNNTSDVEWNGNGECPMGYYCPRGSRQPLPCPKGTFSPQKQVADASECEPCPRGRYCDFSGSVMMDLEELPHCSAGYVCTGRSITPTPPANSSYGYPCFPGFFCAEGTLSEASCPPDTYNPDIGQGSCRNCTVGMRCPFSSTVQPLECLPGYYCPEGTSSPIPCPPGTLSTKLNLTSVEECQLCIPGMYCEGLPQMSAGGKCAAGFYCRLGATNPQPLEGSVNGLCPPGSFCPEGAPIPVACPIGTIRSVPGAANESDCQLCSPGYYCADIGLITPQEYALLVTTVLVESLKTSLYSLSVPVVPFVLQVHLSLLSVHLVFINHKKGNLIVLFVHVESIALMEQLLHWIALHSAFVLRVQEMLFLLVLLEPTHQKH